MKSAAIHWLLTYDIERWAEASRRRVDPRLAAPVSPSSPDEIAAYAERLRQRATPPPPIT